MKPTVRAQYTDTVRAAVAAAVGVLPERMQDLDGFESFVHDVVVDGEPRIVKATWGERRSAEEVGAELHFVNYLADAGAPACRALPLVGGELIESVQSEEGVFHVSCFAKAPGRMLKREEFTPEVLRTWGRVVGTFHRLSSAYAGPPPPLARPSWEVELGSIGDLVRDEPAVHARFLALLECIGELPRERTTFGAMHTDLHHHNAHFDDGQMQAFDFEDMIDFWFVSDLAIVLFYAVLAPHDDPHRQRTYDTWKDALFEGYATEHVLPPGELARLPLFLSLREHTLRAVLLRSIPEKERGPFWVQFLAEATDRILKDEPALGLRH